MQAKLLEQAQVEELAIVLRHLREQLDTHAQLIAPSTKPVTLDQQSVGRVSRIDAIAQQQMDTARAHKSAERLRAVAVALSRVASGDYGYCESCDEPIGYERLVARPETALCLQCQQNSEAR